MEATGSGGSEDFPGTQWFLGLFVNGAVYPCPFYSRPQSNSVPIFLYVAGKGEMK